MSFGDRVEVFELLPPESLLDENRQQSLVYSSDLELGETTKGIFEAVERVRPDRIVLDRHPIVVLPVPGLPSSKNKRPR